MGLFRAKTLDPDAIRAEALDWVNAARVVYRREPLIDFPKGIPNSTLKCPLALAFEDIHGPGLVLASPAYLRAATDQRILMRLPKTVSLFIDIFDDRGYLDLVLDADPEPPNPHFLYVPDKWIDDYYRRRV